MNIYTKFVLLISLLLSSFLVQAEKRALLVGVTTYPNLQGVDLIGPENDTMLVRQVLMERGFAENRVTLLSENEKAQAQPTRDNILQALESLANDASAGDFYYLHFAGHGSRQPADAADNSETDGLDEIFLPSDAKGWDDYIGSVVNAITDDELSTYLDRIRNRGADVWVVFDSCHSGTMTRGLAMGDVRYRQLTSQQLGIPEVVDSNISSRGWNEGTVTETSAFTSLIQQPDLSSDGIKRGQLIAFSAAQSTQTTPEMRLPRGGADRKFHGLFTYTLMNALSQYRGLSYGQLGQYIISQYRVLPWRNSQPLISATDLNAPVFGEEGSFAQVWPGEIKSGALTVQAGRMQGFTQGTGIALFKSAIAAEEDFLGYTTITAATALASTARLEGQAVADYPSKVFAVVTEPKVDFSLSVQSITSTDMDPEAFTELKSAVDDSIGKSPLLSTVSQGDTADIRVTLFDHALWFLQADQSLPCEQQQLSEGEMSSCLQLRSPQQLLTYSIAGAAHPDLSAIVSSVLNRIARGENIVRMHQLVANGGMKNESKLKVELEISRNGQVEPYPVSKEPVFYDGDIVNLTITNSAKRPQDVSVLYKDALYGISQLFPESAAEANRLEPGKSITLELELYPEPEGSEDLIILSQPATGLMQSFSFLEQEPLGIATRGQVSQSLAGLRGDQREDLMGQLFSASGFTGESVESVLVKTRGSRRKASPEVGAMDIYRWRVSK